MHELSIAQNIIEIVKDNAAKQHAARISEVELDIGTISGVVPETLEFALDIAVKGTIMEGAKIKMNIFNAKAKCLSCEKEFEVDDIYTLCPHCGSLQFDIIQGKELKVKSIKIEDNS
jgi:hydrogenase nickel incorporation protein HypA/HybF